MFLLLLFCVFILPQIFVKSRKMFLTRQKNSSIMLVVLKRPNKNEEVD